MWFLSLKKTNGKTSRKRGAMYPTQVKPLEAYGNLRFPLKHITNESTYLHNRNCSLLFPVGRRHVQRYLQEKSTRLTGTEEEPMD